MEEMVGRWWHQAITKATRLDHPGAAVQLQDMQKAIGIFFRTAGGSAALQLYPGLHAGGGWPAALVAKNCGQRPTC